MTSFLSLHVCVYSSGKDIWHYDIQILPSNACIFNGYTFTSLYQMPSCSTRRIGLALQCLFDDCHNQPCKSWSYYADYIDELINQQTNVTIIFRIHEAWYPVNINSLAITIMGESQKATVQGSNSFAISFENNIQVTIKSITFENIHISVSPSKPLGIIHVQFESVNLIYSTLFAYIEGNADLLMKFILCKFYNGASLFGDI